MALICVLCLWLPFAFHWRSTPAYLRLTAGIITIEHGKGYYVDDEPFFAAGSSQLGPFNKLFPQDIRLLSHTKKLYTLLHGDGSVSEGIIPSVRLPRGELGKGMSRYMLGAVRTTVRSYLTNRAVLAGDDYDIREDGAYGIC